jgi:hypothetical protein
VLPPLRAGEGWGGVALRAEDQKLHPLPTSPCKQGEEQNRRSGFALLLCSAALLCRFALPLCSAACSTALLPPLLAGEGWGGVALRAEDQKPHPLPTSPCKQGEEQNRRSGFALLLCSAALLCCFALPLCSLPCAQGRVGVGSLFALKIKSVTPSQPPPASSGRGKIRQAMGTLRLAQANSSRLVAGTLERRPEASDHDASRTAYLRAT